MGDLKDFLEIIHQSAAGYTNIDKLLDKIKEKDSYSGQEVADALKIILDKQKKQDSKLYGFEKLVSILADEAKTTKQITNSKENKNLLGKAFNSPWNADNLAKVIDSAYEEKISNLPKEERYDALAKEIYAVYDIKESQAAWNAAYKIAGEFLAQEANREIRKIRDELQK